MRKIYKTLGKRALDILIAFLVFVVFFGPMILIMFGYYVSLEGTPFFVQERIGKDGVSFRLYKFRTLTTDATKPLQERRFTWGNFLRFTNLDELPQLYNILMGEMSFVGPRPLPIEYLPLYSAEQQKRHAVKPGLTGLAQIMGRHSISWKEKFRWDIDYINNISLRLDLTILFKTVLLILSFKKDISLNEEKFTGNG